MGNGLMKINPQFEKWWDDNEKQFTSDSRHMSEFHMAHVVWDAVVSSCVTALSADLDNNINCLHDDRLSDKQVIVLRNREIEEFKIRFPYLAGLIFSEDNGR